MAESKNNARAKNAVNKSSGRHSALGRGLGALIPSVNDTQTGEDSARSQYDPLDVFFPTDKESTPRRQRGGSQRDLLVPRKRSQDKKSGHDGDAETSQAISAVQQSASADNERRSENENAPLGRPETQRPRRAKIFTSILQDEPRDRVDEQNHPIESIEAHSEEVEQSSITGNENVSRETLSEEDSFIPVPGATFAEIPIEQIMPNTRQPRSVFDEEDLEELASSISEVGVLQPIVVRPILGDSVSATMRDAYPQARFELIMGERRMRASERAGLVAIPAIVRQTEDEDLLRDALLENLHRAQLNPLEEASAYAQLMADFGATQEELSRRIARSRSQIANTLRLLKLPPTVQKKVAAQVISAGHARALLSLESAEEMENLAHRIVAEGLSVRTTEELVRLGKAKSISKTRTPRMVTVSPLGERVVSALEDVYETRVTISEGKSKGRIVIEFAGQEDLQRIADLILKEN